MEHFFLKNISAVVRTDLRQNYFGRMSFLTFTVVHPAHFGHTLLILVFWSEPAPGPWTVVLDRTMIADATCQALGVL